MERVLKMIIALFCLFGILAGIQIYELWDLRTSHEYLKGYNTGYAELNKTKYNSAFNLTHCIDPSGFINKNNYAFGYKDGYEAGYSHAVQNNDNKIMRD